MCSHTLIHTYILQTKIHQQICLLEIHKLFVIFRLNMINQDLKEYSEFFTSQGIGIINASAFGSGLLSGSESFPPWHPATPVIKDMCVQAAIMCKLNGVSLSDLALEWALNQDVAQTTLISVTSLEQLKQNLAICSHLSGSHDSGRHQQDDIKEQVRLLFGAILCTHWENIEVNKYWCKMKHLGVSQICDSSG